VHRVLITEASDIAEEYYFSFLLDRSNRTFLAMCSAEGGMEIEQLAVERPDALARIPVDAITGVDRAKAAEIVAAGRIPQVVAEQAAEVIVALWDTFVGEDATLVEVNPLVRDPQDRVVALDGKVTLDGNADFRHPGHADLVDERTENRLEAKAKARKVRADLIVYLRVWGTEETGGLPIKTSAERNEWADADADVQQAELEADLAQTVQMSSRAAWEEAQAYFGTLQTMLGMERDEFKFERGGPRGE